MRRVVITGIGIVSPIGIGARAFWTNLLAGQSGISRISSFDPANFPSQLAAYKDPALTGATNAFFNNAPIGKLFTDRAKAFADAGVIPFKGIKYGAIMGAVQNGLTRVEQGQQSIDDSWTQVVADIKALS